MINVSLVCFATSYAVTLALEVSRLWFRSGVRGALSWAFAVLGVFTHTVYLVHEAQSGAGGAPLSSWRHWYLLAAWLLAATYLYFRFEHPQVAAGLFLLPLVLGLVGAAHFVGDTTPAPAEQASSAWLAIHGVALLLGTVVVLVGFAAGVAYLAQARRLKSKRPPSERFRLPSLEWLERCTARAQLISLLLVGVGVAAGVVVNQIHHAQGRPEAAVPWTDPVVWTSGLLFAWLASASAFGALYKPARVGQKVAYLTLASFVFLLLVLLVLLLGSSEHGRTGNWEVGSGNSEVGRQRIASLMHNIDANSIAWNSTIQRPTSDFQLPTSDFRLPTSDFRLPTSQFPLPHFPRPSEVRR